MPLTVPECACVCLCMPACTYVCVCASVCACVKFFLWHTFFAVFRLIYLLMIKGFLEQQQLKIYCMYINVIVYINYLTAQSTLYRQLISGISVLPLYTN